VKSLSPSAQAVLDAFLDAFFDGVSYLEDVSPRNVAAALRAAADQVVPQTNELRSQHPYDYGQYDARDNIRDQLLAIAAELRGQ
jgi:hypothetical protein